MDVTYLRPLQLFAFEAARRIGTEKPTAFSHNNNAVQMEVTSHMEAHLAEKSHSKIPK